MNISGSVSVLDPEIKINELWLHHYLKQRLMLIQEQGLKKQMENIQYEVVFQRNHIHNFVQCHTNLDIDSKEHLLLFGHESTWFAALAVSFERLGDLLLQLKGENTHVFENASKRETEKRFARVNY